ncbi:MAG: FHA domain-containing protein [Bdellovibrionota bacterium]
MSSLIIKVSRDGQSQEYLFSSMGPILVGSDEKCDLRLPDVTGKLLEVKISGGNLFIKDLGSEHQMFLNSRILPHREEVRYHEGEAITIQNSHYQISVSRAQKDQEDPPPFFEAEFKERLDKMNFKIREKETELKSLTSEEGKKRHDLDELLKSYQKESQQKGKLSVEVEGLRTQKDQLSQDLRSHHQKFQDEEGKIRDLRDYVKRLENDERQLKENIVSQNLVLRNLKDERENRSQEVDKQRQKLSELELEARKREEELLELANEFKDQEKEIEEETQRVESILIRNQSAVKETSRIREHMAQVLKEKTLLDHEVQGMQEEIHFLENQRKESQVKVAETKANITMLEGEKNRLVEHIEQHKDQELNLKNLNAELRIELMKAEEKLSSKKGQLNKVEFDAQDAHRKLTTLNFEVERSDMRIKQLNSEEGVLDLKIKTIHQELDTLTKKAQEDKRALEEKFLEQKTKLDSELRHVSSSIEEGVKIVGEKEADRTRLQSLLDEMNSKYRSLQKEKSVLEGQVSELNVQRIVLQDEMKTLNDEIIRLNHDKDRAQRDFSSLSIKLMDIETEIKEKMEEAKLEMENFKNQERGRIFAEKNVTMAEVESFKQKSLAEVENEYRRKEEKLHLMKVDVHSEAEKILREARSQESNIIREASARLNTATESAEERERDAHKRMKEAQDYLKSKEKEAELILNKARLDSRELIRRTELDLQQELNSGKKKIKGFLTMKREKGETFIESIKHDHESRLKKMESAAQEKLEDVKRRELKKVAKLREDENSRFHQLKEGMKKELESEKLRTMREINELRAEQEIELEKKKKFMLEHINESKFRHQKNYEEEMKKEKELFERTKRDRVENATRAIMNMLGADVELVKQEDQLWRKRISDTLEAAINGVSLENQRESEQILDMRPQDKKKIGPVVRKFALRFGIPAAVATVVMADVGNFRTYMVDQVGALLKQQNSASQLYADKQKTEWREKNTFNPVTTAGYKDNYTDNIIYTTDFDKVYAQEDFQNDWILKVHDYIVKDLEMSEDIAMDFISAESTLVTELGNLKKDLHPKILDQGIKKMRDHETAQLAWLGEKIPDESKREKFAGFRREYFEKYYNEKYLPGRSMAGQP